MEYIRDILARAKAGRKPVISFEFFTPKTPEGERNLIEKTIPALNVFKPDFCSVTYGAGGSTKGKTIELVDLIQKRFSIPTMAHLTCINATREDVVQILDKASGLGIKNILALRGDPPAGTQSFQKVEGGFEYAYQLVELIVKHGGFSIGVAGFPEGHIECKEGKYVDWEHLIYKIRCGADFVITQLFFDNKDYFRMRDYLVGRGISTPIIPGIIPISSKSQIEKFTALCGAKIPEPMRAALEKFGDDDEATTAYGIEYATGQCEELLREGAPGIHFYTLNKAYSTSEIINNLRLVRS